MWNCGNHLAYIMVSCFSWRKPRPAGFHQVAVASSANPTKASPIPDGRAPGAIFKNKTVVVVGGGDTAVEEALYLAKLAVKVYLIHRRDALRASMILQQRVKSESKFEIKWNRIVTRIDAENNEVHSIQLKDTQNGKEETLYTNGVFIFIGFNPNNHLVPAGTRMNADGFVVTDDKCETNTPGIYVVGDLRERYARQIIIAAADGCLASLAAAHYVETCKSAVANDTPTPLV